MKTSLNSGKLDSDCLFLDSIQQNSEVRSQELGVEQALSLAFRLSGVPHQLENCSIFTNLLRRNLSIKILNNLPWKPGCIRFVDCC